MKDLYSFLNESLLDDFEVLDKKAGLSIDDLLSNDKDAQDETIDIIKQIVLNSGCKRMKTVSKIEWAETERWFVQFPKYKGYTWDILLFHRAGSNFYIYYPNQKSKLGLERRVESWKGPMGLKFNISPRENEIYELPKNLCDACKKLEIRFLNEIGRKI